MPIDPQLLAQARRLIDQKRAADGLPPLYGDPTRRAITPPAVASVPELPALPEAPPWSPTVKLYPELGRLAVALAEDRLLRVWHALRALARADDPDRPNWLPDDGITRGRLQELLGLSARSLRDLLRQGEGTWWRREIMHGQAVLVFVGLKNITLHLTDQAIEKGIPDSSGYPGRPQRLPREVLGSELAAWRALLFRVWVASARRGERRLAWWALQEDWGCSRETLRGYCRLAGVEVLHNFVYLPEIYYSSAYLDQPGARDLPSAEGAGRRVLGGEPRLAWQRPNTYRASGERAARGMTRRVTRGVRQALDLVQRAYAPRRYYLRSAEFAKARNRRPDETLYLYDGQFKRSRIWSMSLPLL